MSFANVTVSLPSVSTPSPQPTLFVEVAFARKTFLSSTVRRSSGAVLDETFEAEYDSQFHKDDVEVTVRSGKTDVLATFTLPLTVPVTDHVLTHQGEDGPTTVVLSLELDTMEGLDLTATNHLIPASYCAIALLWLGVQHFETPYWLNLLCLVFCLIYLGAHRSLAMRDDTPVLDGDGKVQAVEVESMTMADAAKFPFVGSASL